EASSGRPRPRRPPHPRSSIVWRPGQPLPAAIRTSRPATPSSSSGTTSPTTGTSLSPNPSPRCRGNGPTPTAPCIPMPMGFRDQILRLAASPTAKSSQISLTNAYIGKVTKEVAANVEQLLKLGVKKVLVNNLHPIGCTPSQTRTNNYTACDIFGNLGASIHNDNLKQVMTVKKNVQIIDLYTSFTSIVDHAPGSDLSKQFKRKLSPCCESLDSNGYCGQQGESSSELLYTVCDKSDKFFYWDDMHPTHAGWEAIMKQLEKPLKEFVDQE
uniref:Uncharacterized protein n=1 Tax=Aegilops tauschii subsp. strangulata TaxID=200361 RepID=A0A453LYW0_AEGTS